MPDLTPDQLHALDIARELVKAGVPLFVAPPCPGASCPRRGHGPHTEFDLPARWETSTPNLDVVDRWRPGWALCAVMGHVVDLVDVDPRNGGEASMNQLMEAGMWPLAYARAATPSGGIHEFIAPLRAGSHDAVAPGIDVKGGFPDGTSRGFAYIAPTVRVSKTTGELVAYRWTLEPVAIDTDGDDTGAALAELVHKARRGGTAKRRTVDGFAHPDRSPWLDIPGTLSAETNGRRRGVMKLAAALRGRGGWRVDDALAYMRAVVWPQIDQQQSGHPFTWEELEATVRDVFDRYQDGPGTVPESGAPEVDETSTPPGRTFADTLLKRSQLAELPTIEPLIADLVSLRGTVVMVGPTGVGKTIVGMSMAASVGTGHPWLGREVTRVPVLYVVGEGAYGLDARMSALEQAWGYQVGDRDVTFAVKPASLHMHKTWSEMTAVARDIGARFVVLDTFSSLAPEADETKDAPRITRWLSDLAVAIDGTAMLVHHPGWGANDRARGGYQLEANVDEVLLLKGDPSDPNLCLERKKVKDGPAGGRVWLRRKAVGDSVVVEEVSADEASGPVRERILRLLEAYGPEGATGPQLITELGLDSKRSSFYAPMRRLVADGDVTSRPSGRSTRYYLSTGGDG